MTRLKRQVHTRCYRCGRLLVPVDGRMPAHRLPPQRERNDKAVPLTGRDAAWCAGGMT